MIPPALVTFATAAFWLNIFFAATGFAAVINGEGAADTLSLSIVNLGVAWIIHLVLSPPKLPN